jgi:hypothetical protein
VTVEETIKFDESNGELKLVKENRSKLGSEYSDTGIEFFIEPFKDTRSLFPYGNVGLLERNDNQMKVESMYVSSKDSTDLSSPADK